MQPHLAEYEPGSTLRILVGSDTLFVTVTRAFLPFTMSAVLMVSLSNGMPPNLSHLPSDAVLKLHDRRAVANIRKTYDDSLLHSFDREEAYKTYLSELGESSSPDYDSKTFFDDNDVEDGMFEGYIERQCENMFRSELGAYERLKDLHGNQVPRLYGAVTYTPPPMRNDAGDSISIAPVKGILIERINGPSMRHFVESWKQIEPPSLPDTVLAEICASAVQAVDRISDFFVLNEDVRMDNIVVRQPFLDLSPSASNPHQLIAFPCVVLDLGQCRLRGPAETDEEWRDAKCSQDETGAVGFVVAGLVAKFVRKGVFTFKRSERYYPALEPWEQDL